MRPKYAKGYSPGLGMENVPILFTRSFLVRIFGSYLYNISSIKCLWLLTNTDRILLLCFLLSTLTISVVKFVFSKSIILRFGSAVNFLIPLFPMGSEAMDRYFML